MLSNDFSLQTLRQPEVDNTKVNYINAFKFYARFTARDLEGYEMGVPFPPSFTAARRAVSRQDVSEQRDAIQVQSC